MPRSTSALNKPADILALLFGFREPDTSFDCTNAIMHPTEGDIGHLQQASIPSQSPAL